MKDNVVLTYDEFRDISNARIELYHTVDRLEDILSPHLVQRLRKNVNLIAKALSRIHGELDAETERRSTYYDGIRDKYGFTTIWSNYDILNMYDPHPYTSCMWMSYQGDVALIGETKNWVDLWQKAEMLVKQSGDLHHIFIESFEVKGDSLVLHTGS